MKEIQLQILSNKMRNLFLIQLTLFIWSVFCLFVYFFSENKVISGHFPCRPHSLKKSVVLTESKHFLPNPTTLTAYKGLLQNMPVGWYINYYKALASTKKTERKTSPCYSRHVHQSEAFTNLTSIGRNPETGCREKSASLRCVRYHSLSYL